jgi:hypothetical protein
MRLRMPLSTVVIRGTQSASGPSPPSWTLHRIRANGWEESGESCKPAQEFLGLDDTRLPGMTPRLGPAYQRILLSKVLNRLLNLDSIHIRSGLEQALDVDAVETFEICGYYRDAGRQILINLHREDATGV